MMLHVLALFLILQAPASIEGVAVRLGTAEPLPGTRIDLMQNDRRDPVLSATAGNDGKFAINNIRPGEYRLIASRTDGHMPAEYGQRLGIGAGTPINLVAGQRLGDIQLALAPPASISGRVFDHDGEPLGRVRVHAMSRAYQQGAPELTIRQSTLTNDLGEYRLFWLPPGRYYISARPEIVQYGAADLEIGRVRPWAPVPPESPEAQHTMLSIPALTRRTLDSGVVVEELHLPVLYPGTTDGQMASPIDVRPGDHIPGIDIALLPPVATYKIRGKVINGVTGQVVPNASVSAAPRDQRVTMMELAARSNPADTNGVFEISGLVPGPYFLSAQTGSSLGPPGENTLVSNVLPVDIATRDVENVTIQALPAVNIPATITVDGTLPNSATSLIAILTHASGEPGARALRPGLRGGRSANLFGNASFVFEEIPVGTYRVRAGPMGDLSEAQSAYVKSIRMAGVDVLNDGLRVSGPPEGVLEIVIGTNPGTIEGVAINDRREPAAGAVTVVLVPNDRHRIDLYKETSTDASGRFRVHDIAPGNYRVFAWERVPSTAWFNADFIRSFEGSGQAVRIDEGVRRNVEVRVIPADYQ